MRPHRKPSAKACLLTLLTACALCACQNTHIPKPIGYPRIDFPEKRYLLCDSITPFTFEKPVYARLAHAQSDIGYDLHFQDLRATLHLTYYNRPGAIDTMAEDARRMAYKHSVRADAIQEQFFQNDSARVYAILYRIRGPVASSIQFYAIDSASQYLRGALYFQTKPNIDSLAPAIEFIAHDIQRLIETIKW